MGKLLLLREDGIFLPSGEKYEPPPTGSGRTPVRAQVLREYSKLPDPGFQRMIDAKVGRNIFGGPLYRLVWGWNRLDWIGGLMSRYDESGRFQCEEYGLFKEPKYSYLGTSQCDRWIVEKWIHPEMYGTREMWEAESSEMNGFEEMQALGPYPSRGDYELSFVVKDNKTGGFLPLTLGMVSLIVDVAQRARELDDAKRKQALQEEEERKQKAFENELADVWDDAAVAFGGKPNSTQANAPMHHTEKSIADVSKFPAPAPRGLSVA